MPAEEPREVEVEAPAERLRREEPRVVGIPPTGSEPLPGGGPPVVRDAKKLAGLTTHTSTVPRSVIRAAVLLVLEFEGDEEEVVGGGPDLEDQAAVAPYRAEEVEGVDQGVVLDGRAADAF